VPAVQLKAEGINLRDVWFHGATPNDVATNLRWQGAKRDHYGENPLNRGVHIIYLPGRSAGKLWTFSWKRRTTLWEAVHVAAQRMGLSVSVRGSLILLHDEDSSPSGWSLVNSLKKSPVWKQAVDLKIDHAQVYKASLRRVCVFLNKKMHEADPGTSHLEIQAVDGEGPEVTMELRNLALGEMLWCVAELTGARIIEDGTRVILQPAFSAGKSSQKGPSFPAA
jgi:hypothetical protein